MNIPHYPRPAAALLLGVFAVGCSLSTFERASCHSDADCRVAFGANARCIEDGFCQLAPVSPRCTKTYPKDLLQRPERYPNAIVFGSLMDRSEERKAARENAFQLAFIEASEEGGLAERQLAIVFCDLRPMDELDTFDVQHAAVFARGTW